MSIMQRLSDSEQALFERALAEPTARRSVFLDRACTGDDGLRARMERLLCLADVPDGFLERAPMIAAAEAHAVVARHAPGRVIGDYRLLRCLGAGGSADVWLAERSEGGFEQRAAIKIIRDAQDALRERFAVEREIVASLAHPGIARLFDGGVAPDGSAYMVMEYVEGEHLGAYADAHALALPERLALFLQICDAVAYAHTRLIVHRDIKPTNILIGADGQAKLLDFGIAKLLDAEPNHERTHTLHFSPSYAAPEQLSGNFVSTATDVYALGVTLFELLTGRLPWSDDRASLASAVKRLLEAPTPSPSRSAHDDGPVPRRALRGDLDAIVGRALRTDPGARYPDARSLADDLRRHLDHQPVAARAGARAYVLRRFLRRNWLALSAAAAVFVGMAVALAVIGAQSERVRREAERAAAVQAFMVDLFRSNSGHQSDPVKARQTTARELLATGVRRIETGLDDAPENKLALVRLFGDLYGELALSSEQIPLRKQAITLSRRLYGNDSPELASDLIALARLTADHDEAGRLLDEAGSILDRRQDTLSFLRGRLLEAMVLTNDTTDLPQARAQADQAVSILGAYADSPELAEALFMQGRAYTYSGRFTEALVPLRRAIKVSLAAEGSPNAALSGYYQQLAETESAALQHAAAETSARLAIAQARAYKAENDYDLVFSEASLAVVLVNADRPRESLQFAASAKADAPAPSKEANAAYLKTYALDTGSRTLIRAGDPDAALADAVAAVDLARGFDPEGTVLASALQKQAEALVELGRIAEAKRALAEVVDLLKRVGRSASEFNAMLEIRIAMDVGDMGKARSAFAALPPVTGHPLAVTVGTIRRDLVEADIELGSGNGAHAANLAAAAVARARATEVAPSLRSAISDGEVVEGLARLRNGDPGGARPILVDALAVRTDRYLPQSPRIAEAQLALAECELALGHRAEAVSLVTQAKAIHARHSSLSRRYREPLVRLTHALAASATPTIAKTK